MVLGGRQDQEEAQGGRQEGLGGRQEAQEAPPFRGPDAKRMITGTRVWSAAAVGGAGGRVQIRAEDVTALHTYLGEMIS